MTQFNTSIIFRSIINNIQVVWNGRVETSGYSSEGYSGHFKV